MSQAVMVNEAGGAAEGLEGYDAIRNGAAVIDFSAAGKLELSGKNAVQFLNGLVSNDVMSLAPGQGVLAAFPTLQGKLMALARIYHTGGGLLLEIDEINRGKVFNNLSRFVPAGEFFVRDASDEMALVSLQGPKSAEILQAAASREFADSPAFSYEKASLSGTEVGIARHGRLGGPGFDIFVERAGAGEVTARLLEAGAARAGGGAFETARIEAGIPREGVDAGENYIILESELNDAVSYTKGCYLGQEVIARIHWRGQPAKRLRGFLIDSDSLPPAGTGLIATDGKKVGEITSSIRSIALDRFIALGYVHRYYLTPGTEFTLKSVDADAGRARLVEPPFIS